MTKLVNIVAKDKDNIKREVDMLGGNVLELESEIIMAEAERKGLEKGMKKGIEQGMQQGMQQGIQQGMQQGQDMLSKLVAILLEAELYDEIKKVTSDKEYREELYKKYNIE